MMKLSKIFVVFFAMLVSVSCVQQDYTGSSLEDIAFIPKPVEVAADEGAFVLSPATKIWYGGVDSLAPLAAYVVDQLEKETGITCTRSDRKMRPLLNSVQLEISEIDTLGPEGYRVEIESRKILVIASTKEGIFRGITTLRQLLLLADAGESNLSGGGLFIPAGTIYDFPNYTFRGTMLDVARHFFEPQVLKDYIDLIALYKVNYLHVHLSDDQGWRIEIKSWPKLTEIGGSTEVGGGEGGYYTQKEFVDIVKYAEERYITVIPEIDMPGHTNSALASYPELNCDGKATALYTGTRVGFSTLCTDKEITYTFVDDVIGEISAMTPGPYFHVGGDESHVTAMDDYIYFINRIKKIVHAHGKTMIGWDEVSYADLSEGDIAQYWARAENAKRAIKKGSKLIISPAKYCYLDMKYDSTTPGLDWAGYIEVDDAYNWKPTALEPEIQREHILGVESPLWSETTETFKDIQYLAFPRLIGHAEIGWSREEYLDWATYRIRLAAHGPMMERMGVDYYRSPYVDWE